MNSPTQNDLVLTLDVDWAPDHVVDYVAGELLSRRISATWFVTHMSPAIERLQRSPELFELGIHPNFLPGSTHGSTPAEVLRHCMALVPQAVSMRSHSTVQSTPLLETVLARTPIETDVSLFLPHTPSLRPVEYRWKGSNLLRIPYYWEDDFEMERATPCWRLKPLLDAGDGLRVFDFHPIHVYLNSADATPYQTLKFRAPRLVEATPMQVARVVQAGEGTRTLFLEVVDFLGSAGGARRIRDIADSWWLLQGGRKL